MQVPSTRGGNRYLGVNNESHLHEERIMLRRMENFSKMIVVQALEVRTWMRISNF